MGRWINSIEEMNFWQYEPDRSKWSERIPKRVRCHKCRGTIHEDHLKRCNKCVGVEVHAHCPRRLDSYVCEGVLDI